jgi:hypothetical protein
LSFILCRKSSFYLRKNKLRPSRKLFLIYRTSILNPSMPLHGCPSAAQQVMFYGIQNGFLAFLLQRVCGYNQGFTAA